MLTDDEMIREQRRLCSRSITNKPWVLNMFVYSYARRKLRNKIIKLEKVGCKIIYCDTDSIMYTEHNKSIKTGSDMGNWEIEFLDKTGCFHSPKIYAIKNTKIRVKGITTKAVVWNQDEDDDYEDTYENMMRLYIEHKDSVLDYKHVESLVCGMHMYSLDWSMIKRKDKDLHKSYSIKHIKPY